VRLGGRQPTRPPYGHRRPRTSGLGEAPPARGRVLVSIQAIAHLLDGGSAPSSTGTKFAVIAVALVVDLGRTRASLLAARATEPCAALERLHFGADMVGSLAVLVGLLAVDAGFEGATRSPRCWSRRSPSRRRAPDRRERQRAHDRTPAERERPLSARSPIGGDIELSRLRLRGVRRALLRGLVAKRPSRPCVVEGTGGDLIEAAVERACPEATWSCNVEPRRSGPTCATACSRLPRRAARPRGA